MLGVFSSETLVKMFKDIYEEKQKENGMVTSEHKANQKTVKFQMGMNHHITC